MWGFICLEIEAEIQFNTEVQDFALQIEETLRRELKKVNKRTPSKSLKKVGCVPIIGKNIHWLLCQIGIKGCI